MLKPQHVTEYIRCRRKRSTEVTHLMSFYWVDVTTGDRREDRNAFGRALLESSGDYPLLPLVLRVAGFQDPNAVMNDLATVVDQLRNDLSAPAMRARITRCGFVDVVLITRRRLDLAATSSPLLLPEWAPIGAGQEVIARIEDLTWAVDVALSAPEAYIGEIKRLLFDLDRMLLKRVRRVGENDHRAVRSLLDKTRMGSEPASQEWCLGKAQEDVDKVTNPREYRPSSRGHTMVARLWRLTGKTAPDGLQQVAGTMAKALGVNDDWGGSHEESIMAVLGRPTNVIRGRGMRWAFDIAVTVRAACQLVTAAAHGDEYPRYPVWLVGSLSREVRRSLNGFIAVLERHSM